MKEETKDLKYWKLNAEEDYIKTPISVLRYISELEKSKEMEKEENDPLVNYIKDVRDVCGKHYHPTETELHYLSIRAENILATIKSE